MEPIHIESTSDLLLQVSRQLQTRGWALLCSETGQHRYQFTVGLESSYEHPELEVIGLPPDLGGDLLAGLVERVKSGQRLRSGDFFSDLLRGYDLFVVNNPIDPGGPPITGGRLRLIWPDAHGRFPWQPDCDPSCTVQALILEPDGMNIQGLETLLAHSGRSA